MTKLAPEWVRTNDPVIRRSARYRWTTAPALEFDEDGKLFTRLFPCIWWFFFVSQLIRCARVGSKYEDFLFRGSILVTLGLVQNMKIFCSEDLFWFQIYRSRDIPHGLHLENSMVVIQNLFTNLTPLCHICLMICSLTVTYDWFAVVLSKS